ncbi:LysR family transcriptional regulator [Paracidovorax cattleyae]|uniref:DNA-binding transcriptional regulator, LysR family n=1 Tax=Paracidovorax cattleyae TaxID=80868 RepID=A0A1H0U5M0_9BURK|nr:LysR family transcriptional regulator [Paracidovorax cattleyae]SDP61577.1 DNA-binding transcriptional regulator, LysR family [Paracidovorax cattleyae]
MAIRNLDDLTVFLKVVDCGGFSAAARSLDLAPATVSKQIARLEQALGARLFERSTRQLRITDEGRAVAERARPALALLDEAADVARKGVQTLTGTLRITAPVTLGARYLAAAAAAFRERHPQLGFDLQLSDHVVNLYDSDLDLAIRVGRLADSRLFSQRLAQNRRILVAAPAYLRRLGIPDHPRELSRYQCLLFAYPGLRPLRWTLRHSTRRGAIEQVELPGDLRSDNGEALRTWCRAGLGIALRETWDVAEELRSGDLVRVLPDWAEPAVPIQAVRVQRSPVPRRVSAFVEFLAGQWRQAPWES